MATCRALLRCIAMLLLLLAGVDLVANDLFGVAQCEDTSSTQRSNRTASSDDDCFCCCGHIVVVSSPQLSTSSVTVPADAIPTVQIPASPDPGALYRPPRS